MKYLFSRVNEWMDNHILISMAIIYILGFVFLGLTALVVSKLS